ncbi:putative gustatory receptor clone PTE03 [Chanos chanos]|uniref:Gustatory receptor clone PTE03 n=1 Tax=Chanos chanos TaxID=29144 RepID=A0A6J2VNX6_CHACN|nr:putative gustatory receptor clone PTE03 [Chanos chanos]
MECVANITYITFEGHAGLQKYKYVYFTIALTAYLLILFFNSFIICLIFKNKTLHEPMYILIAALFLNAIFGTTAFYPKLLIDFLSDKQIISYPACALQAFLIYTYGVSEFTLLSAMAYDRYVSISKPLQYATLVKMSTVKKMLLISWFFPAFEIGIMVILTSRLKLCKFTLKKVYCDNYSIVKLSCGDTALNNYYGLFVLIISVFPALIFIVFSYIKILLICLRNSKDFRRKALQTCLPHLLIFVNFSVNCVFEVVQHRLEINIPETLRIIMIVESFCTPPLLNPIIYGLKLQEISKKIKRLLWPNKALAAIKATTFAY